MRFRPFALLAICRLSLDLANFRETRLAEIQKTRSGEDKGGRTASSAILENRCVELAAEVQVYSDPASTLRTMAHNHSASQDVGLNAIQQTSGKPQSPTLMDQDIQDRGYQLRRIPLLRCWVNKGDRLDPAPHSCFVAQILFAELPLQVALLAFDDPTLDHQQRYRQKKDGPQRVRQAGDAHVD